MLSGRKKYKKCFFWGASGQAKVLNEFISDFCYKLAWLFDDNPNISKRVEGVRVVGGWRDFLKWKDKINPKEIGFLVAIGGADKGKARLDFHRKITQFGFKPLTVWHKSSYISKTAKVGEGSQILARVTICPGARLGKACIINTGSQVDHDCALSDGVHIMP